MSIKDANAVKKLRPCLRCGKAMHTDRCHRICRKCHRRNNAQHEKSTVRISSLRTRLVDLDVRI